MKFVVYIIFNHEVKVYVCAASAITTFLVNDTISHGKLTTRENLTGSFLSETVKVWANWIIQSRTMIFFFLLDTFLYAALSGGTLLK